MTRKSIGVTALRLIDRDGLGSFSLRSLAKELDVYPSAIYWHLPNRNAILAEVVALVIADVMPPPGLEWPRSQYSCRPPHIATRLARSHSGSRAFGRAALDPAAALALNYASAQELLERPLTLDELLAGSHA